MWQFLSLFHQVGGGESTDIDRWLVCDVEFLSLFHQVGGGEFLKRKGMSNERRSFYPFFIRSVVVRRPSSSSTLERKSFLSLFHQVGGGEGEARDAALWLHEFLSLFHQVGGGEPRY